MTENVFFAGFFFIGGAAVLVFFMKYVAAIVQSRSRASQAGTAAVLADIRARLKGIENILTVVE